MLDVYKIREDFPILGKKVNNTDLIYFDNAATSQTPNQVIDVISDYYKQYNSNIHRGLHSLSSDATNKTEVPELMSEITNFPPLLSSDIALSILTVKVLFMWFFIYLLN